MKKTSTQQEEYFSYGKSLVAFIRIDSGGLVVRVLQPGKSYFETNRSLWGLIKFDRSGMAIALNEKEFSAALFKSKGITTLATNNLVQLILKNEPNDSRAVRMEIVVSDTN